MPAEQVRAYVGARVWESFLKVTIERDAYDRAVSMYRFVHRTTEPSARPSIVEFLRSFPAFKLSNAAIYAIDGEVVADVVLDFDRLEQDAVALQRLMGVAETSLPQAKVSGRRVRESSAELGDEGCRIVEAICSADMALELSDRRPELIQR